MAVGEPAGATAPKSLLYVSTLDDIVHVMLPHLDAARARGWRVEVACQVRRSRERLLLHADAVHDLPMRRFPLHPANIVALLRLVRLIRSEQFTIVHSHNPTGGFVGRLAATLAGVGSLRAYTAHGFHFHRYGGWLSNLIYRTVETVAGRLLSDAVLVINREDYEAARGTVVPEQKLFLTGGVGVSALDDFDPARVSPEAREALRREIGAEDPAIAVVSMVGEMVPRKRHADAILAFSQLRESHPNAILVLAGDGPKEEELKGLAAELKITDRVRFVGFRRDIAAILAATDVFLFPSRQEGLPCAIQEALSMEAPVVATDVRGCADLIDDTCGRLAPVGNIDAIAACLAELIDLSPQERRRMGEAGRDRMIALYDRSACVAQWQKIYEELLPKKVKDRCG